MPQTKTCDKCKKRASCTKLCPEIEEQLPRMSTGKMPKEVVLSSDYIAEEILKPKNNRKQPKIYNNDWE